MNMQKLFLRPLPVAFAPGERFNSAMLELSARLIAPPHCDINSDGQVWWSGVRLLKSGASDCAMRPEPPPGAIIR